MRHVIPFLIGAMVTLLTGCSSVSTKSQEMIGARAPESRLMFFDGSEVPLSSYRGKDVSLLFWATWCTFSRGVIERYEALAQEYSNRTDIEFIAVSVDKNQDFGILKDRIKEQRLKSMTHIFSGNDALDDAFVNLNGRTIPYVVFIDASGTVRLVDSDVTTLQEYLLLKFGRGVVGAGESVDLHERTAREESVSLAESGEDVSSEVL